MNKERYNTMDIGNFRVGTMLTGCGFTGKIIEVNHSGFSAKKDYTDLILHFIWADADNFEIADYNGWKNYETWNVSLWINNDEWLYNSARQYVIDHPRERNYYRNWLKFVGLDGRCKTKDGVRWVSDMLDYEELNEMMRELV